MARIHQITTRDEVPPDKRHIVDAIMDSRGGRVSGPFSVLLHSPEVAGRAAHLGSFLRFDSALSPEQRELAIITAAREFDCEYEWAYHERLARQSGVRDEAIDVVAHRKGLDSLKPEEGLIVRYARELLNDHRVSDAAYETARAALGEQGLTELTALIGYYGMLACALNAFQVQPSPEMSKLP